MKTLAMRAVLAMGLVSTATSSWMQSLGLLGSSPLPLARDMQGDQPLLEPGTPRVCLALPGLSEQQSTVCHKLPETVESVPFGTKQGLVECEYQFRNDRWNCTDTRDSLRIQSTLERGSKETAYLYAITTAGVVHTVAKACSSGNLTECNCDRGAQGRNTPEGWKWGGCSDNLRYGIKFAKRFIDAPDKKLLRQKGEMRNLMNLHNNEAGRRAIARLMMMKCRCHGVSGSCEFKTCWKSLPKFSEVGKYLKDRYDRNSVKVSSLPMPSPERHRRASQRSPVSLPVNKKSLVYIQPSPDYCTEDPKEGVMGTTGRRCNAESQGHDGCGFLCCGRGHFTQTVVEYEKCKCKFVWCCKVRCKQCRRRKHYHTCK